MQKTPTENQKIVFSRVMNDIGKGRKVSISKSMKGIYSDSLTEQPQVLTNSQGWKTLMASVKDDKILKRWEDWAINEKKDRRLAFDAGKEILKLNNRYPKENVTAIQVNVDQLRSQYET